MFIKYSHNAQITIRVFVKIFKSTIIIAIYDYYNKFFLLHLPRFYHSLYLAQIILIYNSSFRKEKRSKKKEGPFSFFFYDLPVHPLMQPDFLFISNEGGVGQSNK